MLYAEKMGLHRVATPETAYNYDVCGAAVLDVGGGPVSLLLKCLNLQRGYVVDPLMDRWPAWVRQRYEAAGIEAIASKGEDLTDGPVVDEVWIYNVLEHTEDPLKVICNAQRLGKLIRLFEWVDTVKNEGHPHAFSEEMLNGWLNGEGKVEVFARGRASGRGYYGIFPC